MTKLLSLVMGIALFQSVAFAELKKVWEQCDSCKAPESAYYDAGSKTIFLSNVAGAPAEADKQGWISKISLNGKVQKAMWVEGLNAPKGMRSYKGSLWVADIDHLVEISIKDGKILQSKKIEVKREGDKIETAKFLNDVAIIPPSGKGKTPRILVSDTTASRIWEYTDGVVSIFAEGPQLEAPNGLLVEGNTLIIAAWGMPEADWSTKVPGRLLRMSIDTKAVLPVTLVSLGNLDGVEKDDKGNYIVSDWMAGKVYRVERNGKSELLVEGLKGAADLAYISSTKQIIVPCMNEDKVRAYRAP